MSGGIVVDNRRVPTLSRGDKGKARIILLPRVNKISVQFRVARAK